MKKKWIFMLKIENYQENRDINFDVNKKAVALLYIEERKNQIFCKIS
ncbi:MAG: hypothetical protein LBV03_07830 [Fusobacteriales bacterium]|nr:hypothetical protein [Fusobacteriales bacterium]